jgi:hypothetical protein
MGQYLVLYLTSNWKGPRGMDVIDPRLGLLGVCDGNMISDFGVHGGSGFVLHCIVRRTPLRRLDRSNFAYELAGLDNMT